MTDQPRLDGLVPDQLKVRSAKIMLDSLEVSTDIGFHEFEIGQPQRLLVTIEIWLEELPSNDSPEHAWNYDFLKGEVEELARAQRHNLQETFAQSVFDRIAAFKGVKALRVATSKPDIYPGARGVGVEIASFTGHSPPL